ncbi:hypothetical protein G6L12_05705 [Agrobacterium rhizogenes]|nr:hypothetical protein [Rhizobium rhizogenes]NTF73970.1 hypothetical protein [Rhizobium rhizogenes]
MTDEVNTIPDEIASRTARLINEAEDMRQQAADDLKQIYADLREELKGLGWNGSQISAEVAALKGAISEIRLDEKAKSKREERGERIDDYVSLLTRARARGGINPRLAKQVVDGMQTEAGRAVLIAAVDIMIEREEQEDQNSPETANMSGADTDPGETAAEGICEAVTVVGTESGTVSNSEIATASQGEAEAPSVEISPSTIAQPIRLTGNEKGHAANTGGDHEVADTHSFAAQAGASVQVAPAAKPLRAHCQRPTMCGSGTTDHCHSCKVAMREREMA